jgi:hypothetical protein
MFNPAFRSAFPGNGNNAMVRCLGYRPNILVQYRSESGDTKAADKEGNETNVEF